MGWSSQASGYCPTPLSPTQRHRPRATLLLGIVSTEHPRGLAPSNSFPPTDPGFGAEGGLTPPATMSGRFPVTDVYPTVESGRRPAKATLGQIVPIRLRAFREGHDSLGVHALIDSPSGRRQRVVLTALNAGLSSWGTDAWRPDETGDWTFTIESFDHPLDTWRKRAAIKIPAGVDVMLELAEGALLYERAADHLEADPEPGFDLGPAGPHAPELLREAAASLRDDRRPAGARLSVALAPDLAALIDRGILRDHASRTGPWPVRVDRHRAGFSAWYEFFPRSEGAQADPPRSGTFAQAAHRLPAIADMGFDVVYLPPIHPIGQTNRKGRNNTLDPGPSDPGSPWAIGAGEGGHDTIHPDLGTLADFRQFLGLAHDHGLEVAMDLALQASPDHPWVRDHPEWFTTRADGTIAYAENPPKKYQDIYPLNFDNDPEGLYAEVERVTRFWMDQGVRIFRVDNPHTKPLWVWDQLIGRINATDPDVLFLAEAFTKPTMMRALAEVGFQQSYTYFTWRNDKYSLTEYVQELAGPAAPYMRPNFWPNTPDILPEVLQSGNPAAFAIRVALAATLVPNYGIYSGYELFEHEPLRPGAEEYLDSEKFQYRHRDWTAAAERPNLIGYLRLLNTIRREHPALQQQTNITFHHTDNEHVIAFSKTDGDDTVIVICTMDPDHAQSATVYLDMPALGREYHEQIRVLDHPSGVEWTWGERVWVRLVPEEHVAHIATVIG